MCVRARARTLASKSLVFQTFCFKKLVFPNCSFQKTWFPKLLKKSLVFQTVFQKAWFSNFASFKKLGFPKNRFFQKRLSQKTVSFKHLLFRVRRWHEKMFTINDTRRNDTKRRTKRHKKMCKRDETKRTKQTLWFVTTNQKKRVPGSPADFPRGRSGKASQSKTNREPTGNAPLRSNLGTTLGPPRRFTPPNLIGDKNPPDFPPESLDFQ